MADENDSIARTARRRFQSRKLLAASIGVATINYAAACAEDHSSDARSSGTPGVAVVDPDGLPPTSGNLALTNPPPTQFRPPPTAANLVAPPLMDASIVLDDPMWRDARVPDDDAGADDDGGSGR